MREWKQKRNSMQHYDRQAAIYDVQYVGEQNAKIEDILKLLKFDSNELVLDLGCGTGFLFQHINKNVGFLVGVDVSQNALKEAKKRIKNSSNIALVRADADNTPFKGHGNEVTIRILLFFKKLSVKYFKGLLLNRLEFVAVYFAIMTQNPV